MEAANQYIFQLIFQFSGRNFVLDDLMIFIAQYLPYILVLGFLIMAFKHKDWRVRFLMFADGAIAIIISRGIVTEVIRFFYHHPRPFEALSFTALIGESGYSLPSGHAAWFFALATIVFYFNEKWGIWYFVFAILNGITRIYVGVHWPLDILAGAVVGVACGAVVHRALKPSLDKIYRPPTVEIVSQ